MIAEPASPPAPSEIWELASVARVEPASNDASAIVPPAAPTPHFKPIDRQQMTWAAIDVDQLVPLDHLARAIWELVGQLDWSRFCAEVKAVEGVAGCTPYDPRLLASLWILAYSDGVGSAREIERSGYGSLPGSNPRAKRNRGSATAIASNRRDELDPEPAPNRPPALVQRRPDDNVWRGEQPPWHGL